MKSASIILLALSPLLAGMAYSVLWSAGPRAANDYREIMNDVASVEATGFKQKDFADFALRRKLIQKDILLDTAIARSLVLISLGFGVVALAVGVASNRKKTDQPNRR